MPEPHQETSLTTTSSQCAVFATSAKCWRRKGATALWVGLEPIITLSLLQIESFSKVSDFGGQGDQLSHFVILKCQMS